MYKAALANLFWGAEERSVGLPPFEIKINYGFTERSELSYFGHIMRRQGSLEKTIMLGKTEGSRKRGRPHMRWIDFIEEAIGMRLQELSRAVEDRTSWTALIHMVSRSQNHLKSMLHTRFYVPGGLFLDLLHNDLVIQILVLLDRKP